jgi:hypothetical protein
VRTRPALSTLTLSFFTLTVGLTLAAPTEASDRIFFPAVEDVRAALIQKMNAETVRIDMSVWHLTDHNISIALLNRFKAGVPVRLIGDRGAMFEVDQRTKNEFYFLANEGVPIRVRVNPTWYPEINHWKTAIFAGQNLVSFGSANFTPFELVPESSTNYKDETVLFSDDPTIVNAVKTKFDRMWNDTTREPESLVANPPYLKNWTEACNTEPSGQCADYKTRFPNPKPMIINTARLEPDNPLPADLVWGQGSSFNNRLIQEINAETSLIQFVIYRLTVANITNALLNKWNSGVQVRLLIEPTEYVNRNWPEFWLTHAYIDKLWAAGVPVKSRVHQGLTHMKTIVTSRYATNASSNYAAAWQRDINYFIPKSGKPAIYQAIKDRVTAMWNNSAAFETFQPQPPDTPGLSAPAANATNLSTTPTLVWNRAAFATSYDVYLKTPTTNFTFMGNVPAQLVNNPPATYSWKPATPLAGGTTYSWRIVSRTFATPRNAAMIATSATRSFTTTGGAPPPPPPPPPPTAPNIVVYASDIPTTALHGSWSRVSDSTSPNGLKLTTPDAGFQQLDSALAAPTHYFDVTFSPAANTPYRLWLRLKARANSKFNDAVWVQFSNALANGSAAYRTSSPAGLLVNLATDSTATSLNNWGWQNGAYWLSQPTTLTFPTTGTQTLRVQLREDGVEIDQIVLSPNTYLNSAPGPVSNDSKIVPKP